jgi:hypothetical protein
MDFSILSKQVDSLYDQMNDGIVAHKAFMAGGASKN